jgi:hypothetical protein
MAMQKEAYDVAQGNVNAEQGAIRGAVRKAMGSQKKKRLLLEL